MTHKRWDEEPREQWEEDEDSEFEADGDESDADGSTGRVGLDIDWSTPWEAELDGPLDLDDVPGS